MVVGMTRRKKATARARHLSLPGLGLALLTALAAALAGLGHRWGLWDFGAGFTILRWAAYLGAGAAAMSACVWIYALLLRSGSGLLLAGLRNADRSVLPDADAQRIGRNRDGRLKLISIGGHNVSFFIQVEHAGASVANLTVGQYDLEQPLPFDGHVERVAGEIEVALQLDDFRGRGAGPEADLQSGRHRGLLGRGGTGNNEILIKQIVKLQPAAAETCCDTTTAPDR